MNPEVILVDKNDQVIGTAEKLRAHQKNQLHRAYSVFLFNNELTHVLLQKRHPKKYHSGNLWSNTCCSHPQPHENIIESAKKRLLYEMGIPCDTLHRAGTLLYQHSFDNGIHEHELDHIFIGIIEEIAPKPHQEEVIDTQWIHTEKLASLLSKEPKTFTVWFAKCFAIACKEKQKLESTSFSA